MFQIIATWHVWNFINLSVGDCAEKQSSDEQCGRGAVQGNTN
jgi:hypothetical protein